MSDAMSICENCGIKFEMPEVITSSKILCAKCAAERRAKQKAAKAARGQQPKKRPGKAQREAIKRAQAAKKAGGGKPAHPTMRTNADESAVNRGHAWFTLTPVRNLIHRHVIAARSIEPTYARDPNRQRTGDCSPRTLASCRIAGRSKGPGGDRAFLFGTAADRRPGVLSRAFRPHASANGCCE